MRQLYHFQDATDLSEQLWKKYLLLIAKLGGNVEGDEFYIKAGLKGRSYHDEIVKSAEENPGKEG